jgi:hypothetical protein
VTDSYLAISQIANDGQMQERLRSCATQQAHLGNVTVDDPLAWVMDNRYLWASSPGWGEKWDFARQTHWDDPSYQPGHDPAVITDADILATVQGLGGSDGG